MISGGQPGGAPLTETVNDPLPNEPVPTTEPQGLKLVPTPALPTRERNPEQARKDFASIKADTPKPALTVVRTPSAPDQAFNMTGSVPQAENIAAAPEPQQVPMNDQIQPGIPVQPGETRTDYVNRLALSSGEQSGMVAEMLSEPLADPLTDPIVVPADEPTPIGEAAWYAADPLTAPIMNQPLEKEDTFYALQAEQQSRHEQQPPQPPAPVA
jgi:hypothetical protein